MVNEHSVNYNLFPSRFTSRIYPLKSQKPPQSFISLQNFCQDFISHSLGNIFKFVVLRLLEYVFVCQQVESRVFQSCPLKQNPPSGSSHHSLKQREITFCPRQCFFFKSISPSGESEGDYEGASVKLTEGSVIDSANQFCCCKQQELPNSFFSFLLCFLGLL